jgi:hypothetical protein
MSEEKLSPIKRTALALIDTVRTKIMTDCSEEEIVKSMAKFHPETNGYFKQDDFVTADKAMRMLHLGQNRNKFFQLTKEYGIENHKISNQNVGFLRKDIEQLCEVLQDEVEERKFKQNKKTKGQRKRLWV